MIIISPALAISPTDDLPLGYPFVGWRNQVSFANVTADSAAAAYPATNLGNPSTANRWLSGTTAEQLVTVSDLAEETDYVGIARHNFGSAGVTVSVEAITAEPGAVWEVVFPGFIPADDNPIVVRFASGFYVGVRMRLIPDGEPPTAAVLFVGQSLVLMRSMQAGFTPLVDGRNDDLVAGWSISGEFLGAIVDGASVDSTAQIRALDPAWYREVMRPWVLASNKGAPFFFAWDPLNHPDEVGFCIFSNGSVRPVINYLAGHEIDISIPMQGAAL